MPEPSAMVIASRVEVPLVMKWSWTARNDPHETALGCQSQERTPCSGRKCDAAATSAVTARRGGLGEVVHLGLELLKGAPKRRGHGRIG